MPPPRIVIVGGGISGMTAAFRFQERRPDAEVVVLERAGRVGGVIGTNERDGFRTEAGPNGFLDNKPAVAALCRDLGLADRLVPASESAGRNRFLFIGGKLHALPPSPLALLRSPLLSWRGKLALFSEPLRPRRTGRHEESVAAFARRRAGREAAEVLADAAVSGIYAGDPALLSLPASFPRLAALEAEYGSIVLGMIRAGRKKRRDAVARGDPPPSRPRLWSFREGLRLLVETLAGRLRRPPELGVRVRSVARVPDGWRVVANDGRDWLADAVVLACPAYEQAAILADMAPELSAEVGGIAYNRIAVVAVAYRDSDVTGRHDGFGYIAPQRTRGDVLGVQWCSDIFPDRAPPGTVLWRALCGGWHRGEVVDWDDARLVAAVRRDLRQAMGVTAEPLFHQVTRWDRAIPQYRLGHPARLERIDRLAAGHPGLFLTGNAYRGVALNDCVEQAGLTAGRVAEFLEVANRRREPPGAPPRQLTP